MNREVKYGVFPAAMPEKTGKEQVRLPEYRLFAIASSSVIGGLF
jgi:hypothetical protein